jgi:exosortase
MPLSTKAEAMQSALSDPAPALSPDGTARSDEAPRHWIVHCLWLVPAVLVFAPTMYWLWQRWTMDVWHNIHGLFIPLVMAYFVYRILRSDPVVDVEQSAWGFLFLVPGLGLIVLDSAIRTQLLSALGMVLCLPGLALLLLGRRRTRALAFVWLLSFFMLPIPAAFMETFILQLRTMTAAGAERVIALCGVPVVREGTTLLLPGANMVITDGCSGFSVLYASVALALVFAYMSPSWPWRVITLAAAFPIAVSCNVVRCASLGMIALHWGAGALDTAVHPLSGMLTFTAAAALLTYVGTQARRTAT